MISNKDCMASSVQMALISALLFALCSFTVSSEVYILSSQNVSCPAKPCVSVHHFAAKMNEYLASNTSIVFLPGYHHLKQTLSFTNVQQLVLRAISSSPTTTEIISGHLSFYNIGRIRVFGLQFKECIATFRFISELIIENSTFEEGTELWLFNCDTRFIKNYYVIDHDSVLVNINGAIVVWSSNLTVIESTFKGNNASIGRAIYAEYMSIIVIANSTFEMMIMKCISFTSTSTYGVVGGGALYLLDSALNICCSTFLNNSVKGDMCYGGVIQLNGSRLQIYDCVFVNNIAEGGGAVVSADSAHIRIDFSTFSDNVAAGIGGVIYGIRSQISSTGNTYIQNKAIDNGGVVHITSSFFTSKVDCYTQNEAENAGVMTVSKSTIRLNQSEFSNNRAIRHDGGVMELDGVNVTIEECNFTDNVAQKQGGVFLLYFSTNFSVTFSEFRNNSAWSGGVMTMLVNFDDILYFGDTKFIDNSVTSDGGVISGAQLITFNRCYFLRNSAEEHGGILYVVSTIVNITESTIRNSSAPIGGVIYATDKSVLEMHDVQLSFNTAKLGVVYIINSKGVSTENTWFLFNIGTFLVFSSNVTMNSTNFISSTSYTFNETIFQQGGAITAFQSDVTFQGECLLIQNQAENGGALYITESKVYIFGNFFIQNNVAEDTGGGIYLYQSELNCKYSSNIRIWDNKANKRGGGMHAISSSIKVEIYSGDKNNGSLLQFVNNKAEKGGGIFFEVNAKLYIIIVYRQSSSILRGLHFIGNSANYGGAIFVADDTNSGTCASTSYRVHSTSSQCFMQVLKLDVEKLKHIRIYHDAYVKRNHAHYSGSILFGGLLDRCTFSPLAEGYQTLYKPNKREISPIKFGAGYISISGVSYLTSSYNSRNAISSYPVRICFCVDDKPDCNYEPPIKMVMKGEKFMLSLLAVDHINSTIDNTTIHSSLSSKFGGLGEDQLIQTTTSGCSELTYEIYSPYATEEMILYAEGPCKDAKLSQRRIFIQFSSCSCPTGFQPKQTVYTRCVCECDPLIREYITDCDPQTGILVRKGNFWISTITEAQNSSIQYVIYPNCPLDYCYPASSRININFIAQNGTDAQCANGHSGKLCGPCKPGLSLSLGSSHCIVCPKYWPALLVVILIATFLAGIVLVATLLICNLTVAVGTLNGIIFYANIINANSSIFLPFQKPNIITVFMSWFNLELGFNTCFFEGMDAYSKTLIQVAFPVYLFLLVVAVILLSEYSVIFARFIGRKNPVATLDTLILLSYTKLLNIVITSLSFVVLSYPNGMYEVLWLPDATVYYLRGKHMVLFLIALLILLGGIVYTSLLFSWQWLLYHQNKKCLKWVQSRRLYTFLEPYHAPYSFKHRYWTGLLLLARAVLYIVSAANVSGDQGVNLLVIGLIITGLLLLKGYSQGTRIYQKVFLDMLEMMCYINLTLFCLAEFFCLEGNQSRHSIAYISVFCMIALFLIVLAYHMYTEFLAKASFKSWIGFRSHTKQNLEGGEDVVSELVQPLVTHSEVPGPGDNEVAHSMQDCGQQSEQTGNILTQQL